MLRAIDVVRRLTPRARPAYVQAFEEGDALLAEYGVTTPLRLAHFLAQGFHESGGLSIVRESGAYSASRIMEIFGVNRHSAKVTPAEAKALAGNGPALFERVYGQGNPGKARELGNTVGASGNYPGDGWWFRGNGLMQTTGRGAHRRLGQKVGLGSTFEDDPDKVTAVKFALLPALAEWKESGCNALADKNDLAGITKRINGGYNGKADRQAWFNKIYPLLTDDTGPAWQAAEEDEYIRAVQEQLVTLGADITVDGRKGPKTEEAIKAFQRANGLAPDGIAGAVTREMLKARVSGAKAPEAPPKEFPDDKAIKSGAVQGGLATAAAGTAGGVVIAAKEVKDVVDDAKSSVDGTWIGIAFFLVFLIGGLLIVWNRYREAGKLPKWLGGAAAIALACMLSALPSMLSGPAQAHEAPSGFRYLSSCCSDQDCRPADPGEIVPVSGGWHVVPSNLYVVSNDHRIHESPDGRFHICNVEAGNRKSAFWCIYIPAHGS